MAKISVLILAKNEEKNIGDCITSCSFAEDMFDDYKNVYPELMNVKPDDPMCGVIKVYDFSAEQVILYSEIETQDCFLAATEG